MSKAYATTCGKQTYLLDVVGVADAAAAAVADRTFDRKN